MKYNELDTKHFVPNGMNINESSEVIKRNAINAFFLRAFELWYLKIQDIAISTSAPYSLQGCLACSDVELNAFLKQFNAPDFIGISHDAKARFVHALATSGLGTNALIDEIVKYCADSDEIDGIVHWATDYQYKIRLEGNLATEGIDDGVASRIMDCINRYAPVYEKLHGFEFLHIEPKVTHYAGCSNDASIFFHEHVDGPLTLRVGTDAYMPLKTKYTFSIHTDWWIGLNFKQSIISQTQGNSYWYSADWHSNAVTSVYSDGVSLPDSEFEKFWIYGADDVKIKMEERSNIWYKISASLSSAWVYFDVLNINPVQKIDGVASNCIAIKPASTATFLPSRKNYLQNDGSVYYIDGDYIRWKQEHPIVKCLFGEQAYIT